MQQAGAGSLERAANSVLMEEEETNAIYGDPKLRQFSQGEDSISCLADV